MISAGNKIAKASGIRIITTEKKSVAFEVAFDFQEEGSNQRLYWQGWIKNKDGGTDAMERTIKTLIEVLDYDGCQDVVNVPEGDIRKGMLVNQDCINRKKDVQIVVEHENFVGNDGKNHVKAKIKWVNNIGGGSFAGVTPEIAKNELGAIGFKAMFQAMKGSAPKAAEPAPTFTQDDLPY